MAKMILIGVMTILFVCKGAVAAGGDFGLGIIVGEPTGPCFKAWTGSRTAIDGAVAWSLGDHDALHLHADYLLHNFSLIQVEKGRLPLYYGLGARIKVRDKDRDDLIGVRIPVGLAYMFAHDPLDVFLEIVPVLDLIPSTDLDFNAAIGVRYFF